MMFNRPNRRLQQVLRQQQVMMASTPTLLMKKSLKQKREFTKSTRT
jgi:hypothetical protein